MGCVFLKLSKMEEIQKYTGWKKRLEKAREEGEKLNITLQYSGYGSPVYKSGKVVEIYEDSFELEEVRDGLSVYSYKYLIEIRTFREVRK